MLTIMSGNNVPRSLPLARIKKITKRSGDDVKMISVEAPIVFSKACELFIEELMRREPSKVSHLFSGTQDKCAFCNKTAYPQEKLIVEEESSNKSCFRCSHGGCSLTPSTYAALDRILYCKPYFSQLFKQKGSYNHLTESTSSKKFVAPQLVDQQQAEITAAAS